jgi:hypothetical protein
MQRTYEYYIVDPNTWKDKDQIKIITKSSINEDDSNATLGSASFSATGLIDECYVRTYLVVNQNGVTEKIALGTHLVQTPTESFDGKITSISLDAYTPLIELKSPPPIGYTLLEGEDIMDTAYILCRENMRAPVVRVIRSDNEKQNQDNFLTTNFTTNLEDTWLAFISDLIATGKHKFALDGMGKVMFAPEQKMAALSPVMTFDDGNSSILYPDITHKRDLYNIPNAVEVVYSTSAGYKYAKVVNDDPNSPVSTVNRGWTKTHRETSPKFSGVPTQLMIDKYAEELLKSMSTLEHTITFKHGYYPVNLGDCILLNYEKAGISNVKAKIISRSITCDAACTVNTTAVYSTNLWR